MTRAERRHLLGLRGRFALFVVAGVAGVSLAMAALGYYVGRRHLMAARQQQLSALARSQALELARRLGRVAGPARDLAVTLERIDFPSPEVLIGLLKHTLSQNRRIYGMAVAFAPRAFRPDLKRFAPYVYRSPRGLKVVRLDTPAYDYPHQDWYLIPMLLRRPVWGEPYYDEGGGGVVMSTYSAPVIKGGRVVAVVTADVSLADLDREVRSLKVGRTGYGFVLTRWGTFLAAPRKQWVLRESIFSLAERLNLPGLRRLGRRMLRGGGGVVPIRDWLTGRESWLAFAPVREGGWTFGLVLTQREVLAPIRRLARRQILLAISSLLVLVVVVWVLVVGLTRPLQRLTASARAMAEGDLSVRVSGVRPGDEVGDLAEAFNTMGGRLTEYLARIKEEIAARQAVESEIKIARQIQESLLPRTFPPFPHRPEFSLFGHNLAAKEVAGDFYDFFFVDDDRLVLVIADVSGKGVPAALFMAVTRTLFRDVCVTEADPAAALGQVNRVLCQDNEANMFVTVFLAYYQVSTGRIVYANGGHNEVILVGPEGEARAFGQRGDVALGVLDEYTFTSRTAGVEPGETLVFYTDGVTEAPSPDGEMFGETRLMELISNLRSEPVDVICRRIMDQVSDFQQGAQFDDITMMALRRSPEAGRDG